MVFVVIGVLLVALKMAEMGPTAGWSWWITLIPFAVAVAWWSFSDSMGITAQRQTDMVEAKAQRRREKNLEAIGVSPQAIAAHRKASKAKQIASERAKRTA